MIDNNIQILNQIAEIRQKLAQDNSLPKFERNFNRIFSLFEDEGFICKSPLGEKYSETRTDCEATIVGKLASNMIITQVIKPVIYRKTENGSVELLQKGIVIVEKE